MFPNLRDATGDIIVFINIDWVQTSGSLLCKNMILGNTSPTFQSNINKLAMQCWEAAAFLLKQLSFSLRLC